MIAALLLTGCLPATYEITADVYYRDEACWRQDEQITLTMKYWREWYLEIGEYCAPDFEAIFPTSDGRCMLYFAGCDDAAPLVTDDPAFQYEREDIVECSLIHQELLAGTRIDCED